MAKNFSRILHQPAKHYASTRWAQGRVLLDSDFNEGAQLLEHQRRKAFIDIVGPNSTVDQGFSIGEPWPETWLEDGAPQVTPRLRPGAVLTPATVELDGAPAPVFPVTLRPGSTQLGGDHLSLERSEHFAYQRDFLQMNASDVPSASSVGQARHLYYLHAFEQLVSPCEDDEIDEPMLRERGPSLRIRRTRRVEAFDGVQAADTTCQLAFQRLLTDRYNEASGHRFNPLTQELESTGRLQVTFAPGASEDPCAPCEPNVRRYLGEGNQSLLIFLTRPDRFVWTTSDSSLVRVRVTHLDLAGTEGVTVELLEAPRSEAQLPLTNRVVELIPFGALLDGGDLPEVEQHPHARKVAAERGAFGRVKAEHAYNPDTGIFQIIGPDLATQLSAMVHQWDPNHPDAAALNSEFEEPNSAYMYARLWHFAATEAEIELPCQNDPTAAPLGSTGVVPLFHQTGRAGDYWLVALRADEPSVVVPHDLRTNEEGVPPHGPRRLLAPIGTVFTNDGVVTRSADCRPRIRRVTEASCVTVTVGDGVGSVGDYDSIQDAIDALPSHGGHITVRPGVYRETIRIANRRNVSLEGCGDASVLESPHTSPTGSLIDIAQSSGIGISGFRIHAVEQRAVWARAVEDLTLTNLTVMSALHGTELGRGDQIIEGADNTRMALFDLSYVSALSLTHSEFRTAQRGAVRLDQSNLCTLEELRISGALYNGPLATTALVEVRSSALVKVRDCQVTAYGQVGIAVSGHHSQDVELVDLRVDGKQHHFRGVNYESRSAVDLQEGARLSLSRSHLVLDGNPSDHAVLVVHGEDVVVRGNRIFVETKPLDATSATPILGAWAWGGVQVRGGSLGVELRDNHIQGGVGHGITLGSVLWRPAQSSPSRGSATLRHGPGRAQIVYDDVRLVLDQDVARGFTEVDGQDYAPFDEGTLDDLTIVGNLIEGMQASGISVLSVLGLANETGDFIEVRGAVFENNKITGNLTYPGPNLPLASSRMPFPAATVGSTLPISVLPFGGIVLGSATDGIDIRSNDIRDNGVEGSRQIPICGIFILAGDGLNIVDNRITENGQTAPRPRTETDATGNTVVVVDPLFPGIRAGIAVMLAGVGPARNFDDLSPQISGNRQPDAGGSSFRAVGNSVRQPEGRALHVVGTGPMYVGENSFSSLGYHGANSQVDRFAVGDVVFVQNLGRPWDAFGITQADLNQGGTATSPVPYPPGQEKGFRRYNAPEPTVRYLLNTSSRSPRMFIGEGGALSFSNNQVIFDYDVKRLPSGRTRAPLGFFSAALMGLDHVSVTGNQFGMRLRHDPVLGPVYSPDTILHQFQGEYFSQVMVMGGMVQAHRNRCASGMQITRFSLLAYGELATSVSLNQLTHEYFALLQYEGAEGRTLKTDVHNIVLAPQVTPEIAPGIWETQQLQLSLEKRFLRLLRRGFVS